MVFGIYRDRGLKRVSMELLFVKNDGRFSSGKMFVSLEKRKLLKPEFMRDTTDQRMEI